MRNTEFLHSFGRFGYCAFRTNFHTRKLDEITVFDAVPGKVNLDLWVSTLIRLLMRAHLLLIRKGDWRRKWVQDLTSMPQLHCRFNVSWKWCLNIYTGKWHRPMRSLVTNFMSTVFWKLFEDSLINVETKQSKPLTFPASMIQIVPVYCGRGNTNFCKRNPYLIGILILISKININFNI